MTGGSSVSPDSFLHTLGKFIVYQSTQGGALQVAKVRNYLNGVFYITRYNKKDDNTWEPAENMEKFDFDNKSLQDFTFTRLVDGYLPRYVQQMLFRKGITRAIFGQTKGKVTHVKTEKIGQQ